MGYDSFSANATHYTDKKTHVQRCRLGKSVTRNSRSFTSFQETAPSVFCQGILTAQTKDVTHAYESDKPYLKHSNTASKYLYRCSKKSQLHSNVHFTQPSQIFYGKRQAKVITDLISTSWNISLNL